MGFFSKTNEPTKAQNRNEEITKAIYKILTNEGQTAKEIGERLNISAQMASALLKQMCEKRQANKTVEMGKSLFVKGARSPLTGNETDNLQFFSKDYVALLSTEERIERLLIENNRLLEEILKKL